MRVWKCKQVVDFDKSTTTVKEERNRTQLQRKISKSAVLQKYHVDFQFICNVIFVYSKIRNVTLFLIICFYILQVFTSQSSCFGCLTDQWSPQLPVVLEGVPVVHQQVPLGMPIKRHWWQPYSNLKGYSCLQRAFDKQELHCEVWLPKSSQNIILIANSKIGCLK